MELQKYFRRRGGRNVVVHANKKLKMNSIIFLAQELVNKKISHWFNEGIIQMSRVCSSILSQDQYWLNWNYDNISAFPRIKIKFLYSLVSVSINNAKLKLIIEKSLKAVQENNEPIKWNADRKYKLMRKYITENIPKYKWKILMEH